MVEPHPQVIQSEQSVQMTQALQVICKKCRTTVDATDKFCRNCGFQLREDPVGVGKQIYIYLVSVLLPPLGLVWTFRYMGSKVGRNKIVALVALILTIVATVGTFWLFMGFLQTLQQQLNSIGNIGNMGL